MNTLRQDLQHYLSMRRGLGFQLREAGKGLADFVGFLEERKARYITRELALAWAQQPQKVQPAEWARRLGFVRGFARYRSATDARTEIPAQGLLPFRAKRARPYIYSDAEIRSLLRATLDMPYRFEGGKLRPWMFHCLFGLLSVAGLRIGEARNLELQDVDLKAAVLTIRGAKFGKTRLVPLHASTCRVLADYIARRRRHWADRTVSSYLFVSSWGNRVDGGEIHRTFMHCPGKSACAASPTATALVCMTCDTGLRPIPLFDGIGRGRIPNGDCPCCPPILAMFTSPTRSGIWRVLRN
jgi:integrase/recombinase XerD